MKLLQDYPSPRPASASTPEAQSGAALFIVVLMSLVVSLMAVQLVNRLVFGNREAILEHDLASSRLIAEAALRDAENDIRCLQWVATGTVGNYQFVPNSLRTDSSQQRPQCDTPTTDATKSGAIGVSTDCVNGYILKDPTATARDETDFNSDDCKTDYGAITQAPAFAASGVSSPTAFYTVEVILVPNGQVGQNIPYYRIRATGTGREGGTSSTVEAVFRPL